MQGLNELSEPMPRKLPKFSHSYASDVNREIQNRSETSCGQYVSQEFSKDFYKIQLKICDRYDSKPEEIEQRLLALPKSVMISLSSESLKINFGYSRN